VLLGDAPTDKDAVGDGDADDPNDRDAVGVADGDGDGVPAMPAVIRSAADGTNCAARVEGPHAGPWHDAMTTTVYCSLGTSCSDAELPVVFTVTTPAPLTVTCWPMTNMAKNTPQAALMLTLGGIRVVGSACTLYVTPVMLILPLHHPAASTASLSEA
jgi:hypothetical protein